MQTFGNKSENGESHEKNTYSCFLLHPGRCICSRNGDRHICAKAVFNCFHTSVSEFQLVEKAWNIVSKNYVDQTATQPQTLAYATIDGMVNSLGDTDNSVFLTPEEVSNKQTQLQGIGLYVSETNGVVFIVAHRWSPAQKAGLQPGDIILDVNGQPVTSMEEAASNIMGPAGTSVTLTIQSPAGTTSDITIVRATIEMNSVAGKCCLVLQSRIYDWIIFIRVLRPN